jgi:hypothetical protein
MATENEKHNALKPSCYHRILSPKVAVKGTGRLARSGGNESSVIPMSRFM